jgi:hypothetical protein
MEKENRILMHKHFGRHPKTRIGNITIDDKGMDYSDSESGPHASISVSEVRPWGCKLGVNFFPR